MFKLLVDEYPQLSSMSVTVKYDDREVKLSSKDINPVQLWLETIKNIPCNDDDFNSNQKMSIQVARGKGLSCWNKFLTLLSIQGLHPSNDDDLDSNNKMSIRVARGKGLSWNDILTLLYIQGLHPPIFSKPNEPNEKGLFPFMTLASMDDIDLKTIFDFAAECNPSLIYKKGNENMMNAHDCD